MKMIRLTRATDGRELWINNARIVSVTKAINDNTAMIDTQCEDGSMYVVTETVDEVLRLISDDPEPKPVADLESVKPYVTVPEKTFAEMHRKFEDLKLEEAELRVKIRDWQKVNEITAKQRDDAKARIAELEEHLKAWQEAASDAKARIAELEEHLKAWQEAASVDLVENPDEPPTPCETPEQLVERLRILYRWSTRAEKDASELRKPISAIIDVITKIPPF